MKSKDPKVLTRFAAAIVNYAVGLGISMETISRETGIKRIALIDQESRIPDTTIPKLWRLISQSKGNASNSIHMALATAPSILGPCEHLLRYSQTFRHGLDAAVRFGKVVADRAELTVTDFDMSVGIEFWHPLDELDGGYGGELGIAMFARLAEECLEDNYLLGVDFAHSPLGELSSYEKFFGVPIRFNESRSRLLYRRDSLNRSMKDADAHLFEYVKTNIELLEDRWLIPGDRDMISQIYEAVRINAELGKFSVEELAITLGVSLRKLQREAKAHDLTVSSILDDAREVLAREMLADPQLKIDDIAAALDYSDARAFRRAFTRWTGETPAAFRKSL
ncbi:MAG: AraC family transcriptional regulator ligand-binding domain-containing protein [Planctomycetota bacterium]